MLAEGAPQHFIVGSAQVAEGADARRLHSRQRLLSYPKQLLNGQRVQHVVHVLRVDAAQSIRLVELRSDLCEQLIRCDSDRCGKFSAGANSAANFAADRLGTAEQPLTGSDVEERLVQGQAF